MSPSTLEIFSTIFFFMAILHTFLVGQFEKIAHRQSKGSVASHFWHYFAEVEVVFGLWALVFILSFIILGGAESTFSYIDSLNYTEPAFVFVIMCAAATKPVIVMAHKLIGLFARLLPFSEKLSFYVSALIIGPLLGSFITEPAAMTLIAIILFETYYKENVSLKFKYATMALLFVNVSIGGTLTHFAAPPVLMVASKWNWGTPYMFTHFGYKSIFAVILSTSLYAFYFKDQLKGYLRETSPKDEEGTPWWVALIHLLFLFLIVYTAHHPKIFLGIFCFFLGFMNMTQKYQHPLKLKESFLVGFFLAGLVTLGSMQAWWLRPLLSSMSELTLFLGATGLTGITDNAALTYLGSLVDLSEASRYALVAGAVAGGGLTVIANAPNPAGFGILKESFGKEGVNPMRMFLYAIIPTAIGMICLYFLPNLS